MANDLAALGFSVDSKSVVQAATDLQKLTAASKQTEQAVQSVSRASTAANNSLAARVEQSVRSAQQINAALNVRDSFDTAAIIRHGQELDALRAKYVPLFAAERQQTVALQEINAAFRMGAISAAEHGQAVARSQVAFELQRRAIEQSNRAVQQAGKGAALTSFQMTNLAFQLNDVATMAALGMDPMRILASQAGQFYQILAAGEGGVRGSLQFLTTSITGLVTPFRLLVGTAGAFAVTAGAAGLAWVNASNDIRLAITGIGEASGVSVDRINAIATAAAAAGQATVGEAREMATALVATGRVSEDVAARAVALGRNLSKLFGEDLAETSARLAKALADPAKGVDDLDKRLAAFDDRTARHIKNLAEQGRLYQAQIRLLNGVDDATREAEEATTNWGRAWQYLRQSSSQLWAGLGEEIAGMAGFGSLEWELAKARRQLETFANQGPVGDWWFSHQIREAQEDIGRLEVELEKFYTRQIARQSEVRAARDSRELGGMVERFAGEGFDYQRRVNELERLRKLSSDPALVDRLDRVTRDWLESAKQEAEARVTGWRSALDLATDQWRLDTQALTARTAAQKGELAFRQTLLRLGQPIDGVNRPSDSALGQAALSRDLAIQEHNLRILEAQRQQTLSAQQRVEVAKLELSLLGQNAETQERARAILETRQQAEQEALRLYGDRNAFDQKHLDALTAQALKEAEINNLLRQRNLMADLQFERDQLARSASEQEVYSRLRSAGMLTNGEIEGAAAQSAAAHIRLNAALRENMQLSRDVMGGIASDLMRGASAADAFTSALMKVADKLLEIGMDNAFQSMFGGKGGFNNILSGWFGGGSSSATNGWDAVVTPAFHRGGLVGRDGDPRLVDAAVFRSARRYHGGGVAGLSGNEVPAILRRGEVVLPEGAAMGAAVNAPVTITIDARGANPDTIAELRTAVMGLETRLPGMIVSTVQNARDRRLA